MMKPFRRILCFPCLLCLLLSGALAESVPYDTYNYDYWNNILMTPAAYVPDGSITGVNLTYEGKSLGAFRAPPPTATSTSPTRATTA